MKFGLSIESLKKKAYDSRDDTIENHGDNRFFKDEAFLVGNTQNRTDGNDVIDAHHITHGGSHRLHAEDDREVQAKFAELSPNHDDATRHAVYAAVDDLENLTAADLEAPLSRGESAL